MKKSSVGFFFCILMMCFSCKNKAPDDVISSKKMENILYDYMLAQAMASVSTDSVSLKQRLYCDAVFKKYDISQKDFDHSMLYYTRHSDLLYKMYKRVNERYQKETNSTAIVGERLGSSTDSLRIWTGGTYTILSAQSSSYKLLFDIKKPTLKSGDKLFLNFKTAWIYSSGAKNAIVVLTLNYDDGTADCIYKSVYDTGNQEVSASIGKKVNSVSAFVYQDVKWQSKPNLFFLIEPKLIRYRAKEESNSGNSIPADSTLRDSVLVDSSKVDSSTSHNNKVQGQELSTSREKMIQDSLLKSEKSMSGQNHFK